MKFYCKRCRIDLFEHTGDTAQIGKVIMRQRFAFACNACGYRQDWRPDRSGSVRRIPHVRADDSSGRVVRSDITE